MKEMYASYDTDPMQFDVPYFDHAQVICRVEPFKVNHAVNQHLSHSCIARHGRHAHVVMLLEEVATYVLELV